MEFGFEALVRLRLDHLPGTTKSKHVSTELDFSVTDNLSLPAYIDETGIPTKAGYEAMLRTLISGVVGCIHAAEHEYGVSSAKSVRLAIDEITRGFAEVAEVTTHKRK